jgi:hypothetical protein
MESRGLWPYTTYVKASFALALGGLREAWRRPLARMRGSLVAMIALAVTASLSDHGRYLFPLKGSLYVLAAVGLLALGRWLACLRLLVASTTCLRGARRRAQTDATHRQAAQIAHRQAKASLTSAVGVSGRG